MTMQLPLSLRLFWGAFFTMAVLVGIAWPAGPAIETWLFPVRQRDASLEGVGRSPSYLWFDWVGTKYRMLSSPGVDVTMRAAGDQFDLALYNDDSRPTEARCTRLMPWARSRVVGVGFHRQSFCIEIPHAVSTKDAVEVDVIPRYRGLLGLWELRTPFPPIELPSSGAP